jgi:hypothetical protein
MIGWSLAAVAACGVAGCGGGGPGAGRSVSSLTPPPAAARQPVLRFVDDLRSGRYADACTLITADTESSFQQWAAGSPVRPGSQANRLAQVKAIHVKARTCLGALSLIAAQTSASELDRLAAGARSEPLGWIGPSYGGEATIGDQDWDITRHGNAWRIDGTNAMS